MLEIAANNASDTKLVDGTTQHLSSVNDHRVALSSVDPTTNSAKSSIDLKNGSKCGDEKRDNHYKSTANSTQDTRTDDKQLNNVRRFHADSLGVEEIACGYNDTPALSSSEGACLVGQKIEELGNLEQSCQSESMSPNDNGPDLIDVKDVKTRCKIGKRKKRIPWSSEYSRRQKNSRRLPRSEMPHDELLKLREKERKAQQLRRERLKRAEETRKQLLKEKKVEVVETTSSSPPVDTPPADRVEEGESPFETDENPSYSPLDQSIYFDGKPLYDCVLKESFMLALGLQQRHKTSEARSVAEFLANNIITTGIGSNLFNPVNGEESCFQSHAARRSVCDGGSERSYQSFSEETSDSSEKRVNSDGLSRKTRRSSLSKEDLERLREKERLAKRRQRAKNKKDLESERPFTVQYERSSDFKEVSQSSTMLDKGNDSTDTESIADSKSNNDNGESSSCADNAEENKRVDCIVEERKEAPIQQNDGKRKAFPRYYDRSMLSAEELESLRRREREYQRRRRARLREAKFKAIGELHKEEKPRKGSQVFGSDEPNIVEDSSKKYETRMSKGISCPSLRLLENNSVFYCEDEINEGKAAIKEELHTDWKLSEERPCIDCTPPVSMINKTKLAYDAECHQKSDPSKLELGIERRYTDRHLESDYPRSVTESARNQWESPINNFTSDNCSPINSKRLQKPANAHIDTVRQDIPRLVDFEAGFNDLKLNGGRSTCEETPDVPFPAHCAASMVDAIYDSDRKILEANGYRCLETDESYRYCDVQRQIRGEFNDRWNSKPIFSQDVPKCAIGQNENIHNSKGLDYSCDEPKSIKFERNGVIKVNLSKSGDTSVSNKWRHWKSGLSDTQLQRRRQSNREAQRRRRMRLRLMQMKSVQEQDQVSFEEIMYKRFTPNKRVMVNDAIKAFNMSKSKLKSMLEKRQKVFMDAQIEKSRSETEAKIATVMAEEQRKKGRGCRIKVTPKRQVIVPCMGFPTDVDITDKVEGSFDDAHSKASNSHPQLDEYTSNCFDHNDYDEPKSPEFEDQTEQTSSRKRKQFCPRRLLSDKERSRREIVPSLVTAL